VVDDLSSDSFKTKDFNKVLNNLEMNNMKLTKTLFAETKFLYLSCRNLNYINLVSAKSVSTYDIVNSNMLLFDKASVEFLNESL
jgi:large subunit ribosomal protein L4